MDCDGSSSFQQILTSSYEDSTATTPIFFILSPGADPVKEVEAMGKKLMNLQLGTNYHNVAMGQGQDVVAMAKLDIGHREGHWVMLQNIHLMPRWCVELEKKLDVFASTRSLKSWRVNLQDRCLQLDDWVNDPLNVPKVVDIARLFNPQSFLTAIKQLTCQAQGLELDKLMVITEVTKKEVKQVDAASRDGAFVTGMFLEGARWDSTSNSLEDSRPKEMFTQMPVINCKAGLDQGKVDKNQYICPTYCVPTRRPYFVFPAQLRTKATPDKWVLAGVAMILDVGGV